MQLVVNEFDGIDQYDTADKANDNGSEGRYKITTCRDTNQTCQHAVKRQRERRLAILDLGEEHRCHTTCGSSEVRSQEHMRDGDAVYLTTGSQLRTGVETEPSEPKDEYT